MRDPFIRASFHPYPVVPLWYVDVRWILLDHPTSSIALDSERRVFWEGTTDTLNTEWERQASKHEAAEIERTGIFHWHIHLPNFEPNRCLHVYVDASPVHVHCN